MSWSERSGQRPESARCRTKVSSKPRTIHSEHLGAVRRAWEDSSFRVQVGARRHGLSLSFHEDTPCADEPAPGTRFCLWLLLKREPTSPSSLNSPNEIATSPGRTRWRSLRNQNRTQWLRELREEMKKDGQVRPCERIILDH